VPQFEVGDVVKWSGVYEWRAGRKATTEAMEVVNRLHGPFIVTEAHLDGVQIETISRVAVKRRGDRTRPRDWYNGFFTRDEFLTAVHRAKEAQTYEALDKSLT
jgi:hypothetical protein